MKELSHPTFWSNQRGTFEKAIRSIGFVCQKASLSDPKVPLIEAAGRKPKTR